MAKLTVLGHLQAALQTVKSYILHLVEDVVDATTDEISRVDSRIDDVETRVASVVDWSPQIYETTSGTTNITSSFNIKYASAIRILDLCYIELVFAPKNYVSSGTKVGSFTLPFARNMNTDASYPYSNSDSIVVRYGSNNSSIVQGYSLNNAPAYSFQSQISLVTPSDGVYIRGWYRIISS